MSRRADGIGPVRRAWDRGRDSWVEGRRRRDLVRHEPAALAGGASAGDVVVSLTSHAARFGTLELAVRSLLDQSSPAAAVVLWVADADRGAVPGGVERLARAGLEIRTLPRDLGPASKLLPALAAYPECRIVTADDDVAYARVWLHGLLATHDRHPAAIACRRAHYLGFDEAGRLLPYAHWEQETARTGPDARLFFTGHGGVLYPPGSLPPLVHDDALRTSLSPTADDVWFNWMARLAGTDIVRTPGRSPRHDVVPGSQGTSLLAVNVGAHGNDGQIARMVEHFGSPDPSTGRLTGPDATTR